MFFNGLIEEDKLSYNLCEIEKIDCKIRNKTNLTLKELTIGKFMYNVYLSSLEIISIIFVLFKFYRIIYVEDFDMMLAIPNLVVYLQ